MANKFKDKVIETAPAVGKAAQSGVDQAISFFGDGFKKIGSTVDGWMKSLF